jgi:hypothetical protein
MGVVTLYEHYRSVTVAQYTWLTVEKFYYSEAILVNICNVVIFPRDVTGVQLVFQMIFAQ